MATILTTAKKNVRAAFAEDRRRAVAAEAERLEREAASRRNSETNQRRAAQAEADLKRQYDGPTITLSYAGRTVIVRPGVIDDGHRLSALHALDVLAKATAYAHRDFLMGRRQAILAGRVAPKNPSDAWTALLGHSDLMPAQQYNLVEISK